MKRYCLDKLRRFNKYDGVESWVYTEKCSDDLETLKLMLSDGYRIRDTVSGKELMRRIRNIDDYHVE